MKPRTVPKNLGQINTAEASVPRRVCRLLRHGLSVSFRSLRVKACRVRQHGHRVRTAPAAHPSCTPSHRQAGGQQNRPHTISLRQRVLLWRPGWQTNCLYPSGWRPAGPVTLQLSARSSCWPELPTVFTNGSLPSPSCRIPEKKTCSPNWSSQRSTERRSTRRARTPQQGNQTTHKCCRNLPERCRHLRSWAYAALGHVPLSVGPLLLVQNDEQSLTRDTCHWKVSPGSSTLFSVCPACATETITAAETARTNYTM